MCSLPIGSPAKGFAQGKAAKGKFGDGGNVFVGKSSWCASEIIESSTEASICPMEVSVSGRKQGWPVPEISFTVTEQSVFVTNQCGFTKKQCGFVIKQCCFAIKQVNSGEGTAR